MVNSKVGVQKKDDKKSNYIDLIRFIRKVDLLSILLNNLSRVYQHGISLKTFNQISTIHRLSLIKTNEYCFKLPLNS
jgi:hypothetical protein